MSVSLITIVDGASHFDSSDTMRAVERASLYAMRHPTKRHLYDIVKSRYLRAPDRLVTRKTLNRYVESTLAAT